MTVRGKWRGWDMHMAGGLWEYSDTQQLVSKDSKRPCAHCRLPNREDDHDACIGEMPGVSNACCGHGVPADAYIQFHDGRWVGGEDAVKAIAARRAEQAVQKLYEESA